MVLVCTEWRLYLHPGRRLYLDTAIYLSVTPSYIFTICHWECGNSYNAVRLRQIRMHSQPGVSMGVLVEENVF